jgi:hypothetical protein
VDRDDPIDLAWRNGIGSVAHGEWLDEVFVQVLIQRDAADFLDDPAERGAAGIRQRVPGS